MCIENELKYYMYLQLETTTEVETYYHQNQSLIYTELISCTCDDNKYPNRYIRGEKIQDQLTGYGTYIQQGTVYS